MMDKIELYTLAMVGCQCEIEKAEKGVKLGYKLLNGEVKTDKTEYEIKQAINKKKEAIEYYINLQQVYSWEMDLLEDEKTED